MDPVVSGALIAGAAGIAGGVMGQEAAKDNLQLQKDMAYRNELLQKEFAQHGIRWKVADAEAAGIHPLYALGAQTMSYSPQMIGGGPDDSMPNAVRNMGQDISRAVMARATQQERELANLRLASAKLDVEGKAIDNQIRASQLRKQNNVPPPTPTTNVSKTGAQELKTIPDVAWAQLDNGAIIAVPSTAIKENIEDNFFHEASHFWRNNIAPVFGGGTAPSAEVMTNKGVVKLPPGHHWRHSWSRGGWIPAKNK